MEDKKTRKDGSEEPKQETMGKLLISMGKILAVILLLYFGVFGWLVAWDLKERQENGTEAEMAYVTGNEEPLQTESETEAAQTEEAKITEEDKKAELIRMIFDEKNSSVGKGTLTITGLTENQKEQLSFQEADFTADLTAFLSGQGIRTSKVSFEKEIGVSSKNVSAYRIKMEGNEEQELQVLFFQKIPGHYLFMLCEKEVKEVTEYIEQTKVVTVEVPVPVQTEAADEADTYDASTLSIGEIPEKLLNYLDNRYELQYRLYDYLYNNGFRDVKEVTIDGYEIDPEEQKVEFTIRISKGDFVTGIYLKDSNTYGFY